MLSPCYHYLITLFLPFQSAIVGPEVSLYLIKGLTSKIKVKTFSSLFHPGGAAVVSCDHFRRHLQLPGRQLGVLRSGPLLGRDDVIGRLPGVRNPAQSAPAESAQRFQARAHICVVRTWACVSVELQLSLFVWLDARGSLIIQLDLEHWGQVHLDRKWALSHLSNYLHNIISY